MGRWWRVFVVLVCSIFLSAGFAEEQTCFLVNEVAIQSDGLAQSEIAELTQKLRKRVCGSSEISQRAIAALQDIGYFRARVDEPTAQSTTDHNEPGLNISLRVHEGARYHITGLQVVGTTAFSTLRLENLFPVSAGDWYGRSSISMGLNSLLHLYDQAGYRDATVVPQFKIDDGSRAIEVFIDIDEGERTSAAQGNVSF